MTGTAPACLPLCSDAPNTLSSVWACCFGSAMECIHRSPFVMKDIGERFPVAANQHLKDTGRHPHSDR